MLASPGVAISWKATKVEVAKSGDLGFVTPAMAIGMFLAQRFFGADRK